MNGEKNKNKKYGRETKGNHFFACHQIWLKSFKTFKMNIFKRQKRTRKNQLESLPISVCFAHYRKCHGHTWWFFSLRNMNLIPFGAFSWRVLNLKCTKRSIAQPWELKEMKKKHILINGVYYHQKHNLYFFHSSSFSSFVHFILLLLTATTVMDEQ